MPADGPAVGCGQRSAKWRLPEQSSPLAHQEVPSSALRHEPCRGLAECVDQTEPAPTGAGSMGKTTGRRQWLSMVARGAAAATVGIGGRPRAARSDEGGGHPRIKHVVVLMMENRSFDHMFGLLMNEIP